jgi:histidinol-phosphate/aromatic aminotransferase/cobyric acid decarboxylase-like protein
MGCPACERLIAEYERLKAQYAVAVLTLNAGRSTSPASDYISLRTRADEKRIEAEAVRRELEQHRGVHLKQERSQ